MLGDIYWVVVGLGRVMGVIRGLLVLEDSLVVVIGVYWCILFLHIGSRV